MPSIALRSVDLGSAALLQGYMLILSLCMTMKYGGPMNLDTGAGFVDVNNYRR
jgi:hypothetical protein